jgi:cytosine/adenosine deaminase-related metal-dependent hydrolase
MACAGSPPPRGPAGASESAAPGPRAILIRNTTIIDVASGALSAPRTILIEKGRIRTVAAGGDVSASADVEIVDGTGRFLMPGLWDMHTHALERWRWAFPLYVANGVTGIRDLATPMPLDEVAQLRERVTSGALIGPRFLAAGPYLDGPATSRYLAIATAADARVAVDSLHRAGADFIKVYDGLPREAFHAVMEAAARRGIPVAGHIPEAFLEDPSGPLAAGMRSIEHADQLHLLCAAELPAIMRLLRRSDSIRSEGDTAGARDLFEKADGLRFSSYDPELCERRGRTLAVHGTWFVPTLTLSLQSRLVPGLRSVDSLFATPEYRYVPLATLAAWKRRFAAAATDTVAETVARAREETRQTFAKVRDVARGGAGLLAGTDGSAAFQVFGFNLHDELAWLVEAGFTPLAALQSATINPARYFGRSGEIGAVEPGVLADLVLLEANPLTDIANTRRIHAVVLAGRLLRRSQLDSILFRVAELQEAEGRSRQ